MPVNDALFTVCGKFRRGACAMVFVRCARDLRANRYSVRDDEESHDHQPTATSGLFIPAGRHQFSRPGRPAHRRRTPGTQRQAAALRRAKPANG